MQPHFFHSLAEKEDQGDQFQEISRCFFSSLSQTFCGQAGIILGVVSKSTEQTVSTALQESGAGMLDGGHSR